MSIGGEHSNVSGGQVGGQVPVSGPSTDPNSPSFSNPILEATLLNQLVNITQPASDMPSTTTPEGSVQEDSNSQSEPLAPIEEKQEQSQGRGSSGGQEKGDGERSNDQNAGYNSSVLAESSSGNIAIVMAEDLQQAFTESDYAKVVASDSISNAQEASTGALDEASYAASQTRDSAIDQANAQTAQAAGSIAGAGASMGAMGMGFMSQDNWNASKTLDSYSTTNKAFTAYKETPPPGPRGDLSTANPGVPTENGVATNIYDPTTSNVKLNPQREYSQSELGNPDTGKAGPIYTEKEYNEFKNNPGEVRDRTEANPDAKDVNGFTAQQKLNAMRTDCHNGTDNYQFPKGTYSTAQRQTVLSGKPLDATSSDDQTTKNILYDAKEGGYPVTVTGKTPGELRLKAQNSQVQNDKTNTQRALVGHNHPPAPTPASEGKIIRSPTNIAQNFDYTPTNPFAPPLSSREIDINPTTNGNKVTYTASDRINYEKWNATTISKRVSDPSDLDERSTNGPAAQQKIEAIKADIKNRTNDSQRPEGWYTADERTRVAGGNRLSKEVDPTGEKTRAIAQDLKIGGFPLQGDVAKMSIPDPTNAAASLKYNENGVATTADNPGANLAQGQAKLSRFNEFSSDEIGANPDGTLKRGGGPVYTAQDREQYLAAQKSKKPDGIQDDDVNGISANAKRKAIQEDLGEANTAHMFPKGTYTTQDRQEFYATGKLSNDPDGSKRTAILKDLHASGSSDAIQHIKATYESGIQNASKSILDTQQRYSLYAQALSGAFTGFAGIGAAQLNIQAANAKQNADLAQATAQQLASVQSMNLNQGMGIASGAIQAAAAATSNINSLLQAVIRNQ